MIIDKAFKLLRKIQESYESGGQIRHSAPLDELRQYAADRDFKDAYSYHSHMTTPNADLFDKTIKRKLGIGVSEDYVLEVLHTTTTGTGPKFHMPDENTLIIEASHSVDIEQEKLTNIEDLGRTHRYYGKGKTVINFIKEPKEWPKEPEII